MAKLLVAALAATVTDPTAAHYLDQSNDYLDELITLRQAAEEIPRRRAGRKCAMQTLYRWTGTRGCKGTVLRSTQVGCCRCTTRRWLGQFFAALASRVHQKASPTATTPVAPQAARTSTARRRAAERIDRELKKLGV
jgi:hypothetical protein